MGWIKVVMFRLMRRRRRRRRRGRGREGERGRLRQSCRWVGVWGLDGWVGGWDGIGSGGGGVWLGIEVVKVTLLFFFFFFFKCIVRGCAVMRIMSFIDCDMVIWRYGGVSGESTGLGCVWYVVMPVGLPLLVIKW